MTRITPVDGFPATYRDSYAERCAVVKQLHAAGRPLNCCGLEMRDDGKLRGYFTDSVPDSMHDQIAVRRHRLTIPVEWRQDHYLDYEKAIRHSRLEDGRGAFEGLTIVGYDAEGRTTPDGRHVATLAALPPLERRMRDAIADRIGCGRSPYEIGVATAWAVDDAGEAYLKKIFVTPVPASFTALPMTKQRDILQDIVRNRSIVPNGHEFWDVDERLDALGRPVVVFTHRPFPTLPVLPKSPATAAYDMVFGELIETPAAQRDWSRYPFAMGPTGELAYEDLGKAPHSAKSGETGSGKSVALHAELVGRLLVGHDVMAIDCSTKKGADFEELSPYLVALASDVVTAAELWRAVKREAERRSNVNKAHGVNKFPDLMKFRASHPGHCADCAGIRPLTVVHDELIVSLNEEDVAKRKEDHPLYEEETLKPQERNDARWSIRNSVQVCVAEFRAMGIFLIAAGQRFDVSMIGKGGGYMRNNLGSTMMCAIPGTIPSGDAVRMLFPNNVPEVTQAFEVFTKDGEFGCAVRKAEGGGVEAVRIPFLDPSLFPSWLDAAGVERVPASRRWKVGGAANATGTLPANSASTVEYDEPDFEPVDSDYDEDAWGL